ncbi:unnamed protein product [Aureobasidium uvarum]|uniref:Uncharacterized protein n=1 Tax=Aureobasidium uvarum TaxID=2773716 RepID=A0A9N8KLM3_9PEZI|nr:unnamed protein product [Aureobasidium uvarum]
MHALGFVYGNWPYRDQHLPPEPYYVDTRVAELGLQWQRIVFGPDGSNLDPINQHVGCSYGLLTTRWPGPTGPTIHPKFTVLRMSKRKFGHVSRWRSYYAVSMDWVRSLFTDAFWDEVQRNGAAGLHPERKLGVRLLNGNYKWYTHEVQQPYVFVESPKSVLSEEDDVGAGDRRIIDRHDFPRHISKKEAAMRRSDQGRILFYFFLLTVIVVWGFLPDL